MNRRRPPVSRKTGGLFSLGGQQVRNAFPSAGTDSLHGSTTFQLDPRLPPRTLIPRVIVPRPPPFVPRPLMRVLVVEDDAKIASFVTRGLKQAGYAVDHAPDGETGLALAESTDYDAAIVDVMLPQLDGISLVKRLRAARRPIPVLFLSAKSSVDDRVRGLQAGGDDYLTKPFAFSELVARVQALIRRATSSPEATRLVAGDATLDLVTREVTCAGQPVDLQPREFSLLAFLLRHAGRPVSKTMILEHVWDYSFDPQTNVVDVVMSRLRAKIDPDHKRIETVRGVGYIFRPHGHA